MRKRIDWCGGVTIDSHVGPCRRLQVKFTTDITAIWNRKVKNANTKHQNNNATPTPNTNNEASGVAGGKGTDMGNCLSCRRPPFGLDASDEEVLSQCREYLAALSEAQRLSIAAEAEKMSLCEATGANRLDLMMFLIEEKKVDVNAADNSQNASRDYPIFHTRLYGGTKSDLPHAAKLLLAAKANPNQVNGFGWTPLMMNKMNSPTGVVDVLIKGGADVNMKTRDTAIQDAAWNGATAVVKRLIEAKADLELRGDSNWTVLQSAVATSCFGPRGARNPKVCLGMVKSLLEAGAQISSLTNDTTEKSSNEMKKLLKALGWGEPGDNLSSEVV